MRMRLLLTSPTYIVPLGTIVIPNGALNLEEFPKPSKYPLEVCPARVVTAPPGETILTR